MADAVKESVVVKKHHDKKQEDGPYQVRVLMFSMYFPPQYSGAAKQSISLAKHLKKRGHYIEFVTIRWPGLPKDEVIDGFHVHRVEMGQGAKHKELRLWWDLFIYGWKRRRDFDVFHSHGAYYINSVVGPMAKLLGWKSLVKASLEQNDLHGLGTSLVGRIHLAFLRLVDAYIAISKDLQLEFLSSGVPKERVILLPNGVDTDRFHPAGIDEKKMLRDELNLPGEQPIILAVGVFDRRKNIHWLMEQWVENCSFNTGGLLLAIGPQSRDDPNGEFIGILKQMSKNNPTLVQILEEVDDIERYYRAADIFILPSHGEGMPNVLLEAMASGLPCVATRVSGVVDLVSDGDNGYTYVPNDEDGLRSALQALIDGHEGLLGHHSRAFVERDFGLSSLAERYEDLYRRMTIKTLG